MMESSSSSSSVPQNILSPQSRRASPLFQSSSSENSQDDTKNAMTTAAAQSDANNAVVDEKQGVMRGILLAVPLFCKFLVVIVIKFLTDLVVFPLLFLYRTAGITKRKVIKFFSREDDISKIKPNGER